MSLLSSLREAIEDTSGKRLPENPYNELVSAAASQYPGRWKGFTLAVFLGALPVFVVWSDCT